MTQLVTALYVVRVGRVQVLLREGLDELLTLVLTTGLGDQRLDSLDGLVDTTEVTAERGDPVTIAAAVTVDDVLRPPTDRAARPGVGDTHG